MTAKIVRKKIKNISPSKVQQSMKITKKSLDYKVNKNKQIISIKKIEIEHDMKKDLSNKLATSHSITSSKVISNMNKDEVNM